MTSIQIHRVLLHGNFNLIDFAYYITNVLVRVPNQISRVPMFFESSKLEKKICLVQLLALHLVFIQIREGNVAFPFFNHLQHTLISNYIEAKANLSTLNVTEMALGCTWVV